MRTERVHNEAPGHDTAPVSARIQPFYSSIMKFLLCLACAALGVCLSAPLHAAKEYPLWEAGIGVGALTLPDYRGSDERTNYVFPLPYFIYRGDFLRVDREGAQTYVYKGRRAELDFSLSAANPAKSDENDAREGMSDLNPTFEIGPRFTYRLAGSPDAKYELKFELPVRTVTEVDWPHLRHVGWLTNPLLNLDIRNVAGSAWNMGVQGGPVFADASYHEYYYGVDPQFARAGRPAYDADGGYSGSQVSIGGSRRYNKWWLGAFIRYYDLHGSAMEDSPLVKRKNALFAGLGFAYVFAESDRKMLADK